ncbi:uncharacterized protein TNCV_4525131 [Trichonephila clavipes]|nr:uncharacterized protein TNCV_4525131 [Trichonephila clavipes]
MWITGPFILCSILLSNTNTIVSGKESDITGEEVKEYDEKLSEFIKEILENFREQMPEGIPDIGIPPIDPLVIPDIDEDIDDGIAKMVLRMRDINILGISKFHIVDLKADLEKGFANFSISLPELTASGDCYMNGKILGIFPMNSDGPFNINVTESLSESKEIVLQRIPGHCGVTGKELADHLAKKGISIQKTTRKAVPFTSAKRIIKIKMNDLTSIQYSERNSSKIWLNNLKNLPMWPRRKAVAEFRLATGHDCLLKHYRILVAQVPFCTLCDIWEDMDADHIRRCPALKGFSLCDLY